MPEKGEIEINYFIEKEKSELEILHKPNDLICKRLIDEDGIEIVASALELKTINVLLYEFQKTKEYSDKKIGEIEIDAFCEATGINKDKNGKYPISRIIKEFQKLNRSTINFEYEEGCISFSIFPTLEYDKPLKVVRFELHDYIVRSMKNNLISFESIVKADKLNMELNLVDKTNSRYADINISYCKMSGKELNVLLFYEFIKKNINYLLKFKNARVELEVEEFKSLMGISGYKENNKEFENKVVINLIQKLATEFNIPISYTLLKGARGKIKSIKLFIEESNKDVVYKLIENEKTFNLKNEGGR